MMRERLVEFTSDGLRLEGALHDGAGTVAAVVLHPHPQFGGDMHNHVVVAVAEALAAAGATTLRFNFRGTGRSEGTFDGGRGEADDARAALALLREARPGALLVLAGYSFGAIVAATAGGDGLRGLILISPPMGGVDADALPDVATLVITGEADAIAPPAVAEGLAGADRRVVVVPGADHGWWPGAEQLSRVVGEFVAELG
jgi:alpha/beta superfamily hydrolase